MTASNEAYSAIEKLDASHDVDAFDCGKEPLDQFLKRYALVNLKAGSAQKCSSGRLSGRFCVSFHLARITAGISCSTMSNRVWEDVE